MAVLRYLVFAGVCLLSFVSACEEDKNGSSGSSNNPSASVTATQASSTATSSSTGMMGCGPTTNLSLTCSVQVTNAMMGTCDVLTQNCPMGQWCTIVGGTTTCVPNPGGVKCKGET